MAIQEHLDILQRGVEAWNAWRTPQPTTLIDLSGAHLNRAHLSDADLSDADLNRAHLSDADLRGAHLSGADLRDADLSRVHLSGADLSGAHFSYANLRDANLRDANLNRANLSGAHLSDADLSGADLSGADLRDANLSGAHLRDADLRDADLNRADLRDADLSGAHLSGANLNRANLNRANLNRANLNGADLSGAAVGWTVFGDVDLRTIKNLETVQHNTPSYISTSTLSRSQGDIPDIFLRGAGLDDTFIDYVRSFTTRPIEYYTCFISYASEDKPFAERLHNDLQQKGVRCWFAPEDLDVGDMIKRRTDESIRNYDKLLLILSSHSINSSWVAYQVDRALNKEPQGTNNVLYPVRIDTTILTCTEPWAYDIKTTRYIGNFEHWTNPQQYEANFKRLLRALNTKKKNPKA